MLKWLVAACFVSVATAIPIDNGVQGDPEIECGPTSIQTTFNTLNNFEGHVYVKGLYDQQAQGCRTSGDGSRAIGSIELPFDTCNVQRERSANPKVERRLTVMLSSSLPSTTNQENVANGIFVRTTVIITFHPNFMTKIDRAYTLQCFYMEADKTVDTNIEVSMITTEFQTQFVPMPICRYEILDAPGGEIVQYAIIGQAVYHKWTCDTETVDTFCMYVYSCFVVDPAGADRLDLIDESGCAIDKYLMGNIEYPTDLMGQREVHVFKYADRPALFFQCQIQITVKEPNADCVRPNCPEPSGRGDGSGGGRFFSRFSRRNKREVGAAEIDVGTKIETLDLDDGVSILPPDLAHRAIPRAVRRVTETVDGVCLSMGGFAMVIAIMMSLCAAIATILVMMSRKPTK